jgi:hypothetical protein
MTFKVIVIWFCYEWKKKNHELHKNRIADKPVDFHCV